jgi:glutathione S-transferase
MLGSPYSLKLRAVLRYRRIPFVFVPAVGGQGPIAHVRPPLIPVLRYPDGSWHVDSTPIIDDLEARHPDGRSVVPRDPVHAFLAFLLEDFADEWVTKAMFHYRWYHEADQQSFAREGAFDALGAAGREPLEQAAAAFRRRQIRRMPLVGCTDENRPLIEESFAELVRILDAHVTSELFLFGSRPSRADFALFGQLSQLASDPTPSELMREIGPYAFRWVHQVDDLCGLEGEWRDGAAPLPDAVLALLRACGEVYLPFLRANAAAFERGAGTLSLRIRGRPWSQATFKYQVECLAELRRRFAALDGRARARASAVLAETGGLEALAG